MSATLWQELLAAALVGTDRRPWSPRQAGGELGQLLQQIDTSDPERCLLDAAAAISLHRRAGRLPSVGPVELPAPCPPDQQVRCHPRANRHLSLLLSGTHGELLPEWLAAAAQNHLRAHENNLPALLEFGKRDRQLRPLLLPVLGHRGRWLASQNPDWSYAAADLSEQSVWETGSQAARLLWLEETRSQHPGRARQLLSETWEKEVAKDRAQFLGTLSTRLSLEDEPFLEQALDDRSQQVRQVAAELLAQLPDSQLCKRSFERARPLLQWTPGKPKRLLTPAVPAVLGVTLPDEYTEEMARDGVTRKPLTNRGPKAWWLTQLLAAVPPTWWEREFDTTPAELVEAAGRTAWRGALLEGWASAAKRQASADWAEALICAWMDNHFSTRITTLMETLPPPRREAMVRQILAKAPSINSDQPGHWAIHSCTHQWSLEFSQAVIQVIRRHVEKQNIKYPWKWSETLQWCARQVQVGILPQAERTLRSAAQSEKQIDHFLITLHFRQEMLEALNETEEAK